MIRNAEVRDAVAALASLGPLPTEAMALSEATKLDRWEELIGLVSTPLSDPEAMVLGALFPPDESDAFGAAWALVHLMESAPSWPIREALSVVPGYWRAVLLERLRHAQPPEVDGGPVAPSVTA